MPQSKCKTTDEAMSILVRSIEYLEEMQTSEIETGYYAGAGTCDTKIRRRTIKDARAAAKHIAIALGSVLDFLEQADAPQD